MRAVRFDLDRLEAIGNAVPVVEHVVFKPNGITSYDVSNTGTLVYIEGARTAAKRTVVWVDRQGREEPIDVPTRAYAYVRLSPDETRLALDVREEQNDIWIWDLGRKTMTRLTFDPGLNRGPVWSPDGRRVAFSAGPAGAENVQWQLADGSSSAEALTTLARGSLGPTIVLAGWVQARCRTRRRAVRPSRAEPRRTTGDRTAAQRAVQRKHGRNFNRGPMDRVVIR